jgi:hypothetical protein
VADQPIHAPWYTGRITYPVQIGWTLALGILLWVAPDNWYGPTWWYFTSHTVVPLPSGGTGMGIALSALGATQLVSLVKNWDRALAVLFFLAGVTFWTAGIIFFTEGIAGHTGLMEAPFMCYCSTQPFICSVMVWRRKEIIEYGRVSYLLLITWIIALGVFLVAAPPGWFGPSWSYFRVHKTLPLLPGGLGLGSVLLGIGVAQLITMWWHNDRTLVWLFFLSGFTLWSTGIIIFFEGLIGHQGLMEAPFMLYCAIHKFVAGSQLSVKIRFRDEIEP